MKSLEEAKEYCDKNLRAVVGDLERRRVGLLPRYGQTARRIFAVGLMLIPFEYYFSPWLYGSRRVVSFPALPLLIMIAAFVVKGLRFSGRFIPFREEFKDKVIRPLIQYMAPEIKAQKKAEIPRDLIQSCGLFLPLPADFSTQVEDAFEGTIEGLKVFFAQVSVTYTVPGRSMDDSDQTVSHTGLLFSTEFHKNFKSRTLIRSGDIEGLIGGYMKSVLSGENKVLKTAFQIMAPTRASEKRVDPREQIRAWGDEVRMEHPEFEKIFEVRSQDPVEARYILSTSLIQRILDYHRWAHCPIEISFVSSKMHVFLKVGDVFDLHAEDLNKSFMDFQTIAKRLRELVLVGALARDLDQTTRIWSKK